MSPLLAPYSEDVEDAAPSRQLRDLLGLVLLLNAAAASGRRVDFLRLPTLSSAEDKFFAPVEGWRPAARGLSQQNPPYTIAPSFAVNFARRGKLKFFFEEDYPGVRWLDSRECRSSFEAEVPVSETRALFQGSLSGRGLRIASCALGHATPEAALTRDVCAQTEKISCNAPLGKLIAWNYSYHPEINCLSERERRNRGFICLVHRPQRIGDGTELRYVIQNAIRQR